MKNAFLRHQSPIVISAAVQSAAAAAAAAAAATSATSSAAAATANKAASTNRKSIYNSRDIDSQNLFLARLSAEIGPDEVHAAPMSRFPLRI